MNRIEGGTNQREGPVSDRLMIFPNRQMRHFSGNGMSIFTKVADALQRVLFNTADELAKKHSSSSGLES
jgi:hypothetical protein